MEIPAYQPFYLQSLEELRAEIARLDVQIPLRDNLSPLGQPLSVGGRNIPNRFCAQPITGGDATPEGAPGRLTRRRYRRYAEGRFGLIWVERTSTGGGVPEHPGQLCLNKDTLPAFRRMVEELRAAAPENPTLILQIASAHPSSCVSLVHAATLAAEAGFDGVDLQCPRDALPEAMAEVRKSAPQLLLATRICLYDAVRMGFGVAAADYRQPDPVEPIRFVQLLRKNGLALLNVTAASPRLHGPERGVLARPDSENPDEHPLMTLERQLQLAQTLRSAIPGLPVVGSGFSWLRQFIPEVAAAAIHDGMLDFVGLGRSALAHPSAPHEIFSKGRIEAEAACILCFACSQLHQDGKSVGCVIRDPAVYGPIYQQMRRFDNDQLQSGAARCHLCEAAPCSKASATQTDIPGFIQAFRSGDESRAYEIIRARDPLPELTAILSPAWIEREGACIETTLTGKPVPILDLQYAISWRARARGATGVRLPLQASGKSVGIVGAGPAGLAAAIRLLELGHSVELYEQTNRLGGVPARVIFPHRMASPQPEIEAILQPALDAARLRLHFGVRLGTDLQLGVLHSKHAAILVATGLWQERSLGWTPGMASPPSSSPPSSSPPLASPPLASLPGVTGALPFIESSNLSVPDRVALLAGGDAAMDAARIAQNRGAKEIFVIFGGPRSAMHWHMPESWFATPGGQAMMNWQPLGYVTDPEGRVCGVQLRHAELLVETVLPVGLVIEAMELQVEEAVSTALRNDSKRTHTVGALVNGGASVSRCVAEGVAAANTIHQEIFP